MGIYLDHAATSPIRPEIKDLIASLYESEFGNPSSQHSYARKAREILDGAREQIAGLLNINYGNIIFTSGGTESDNLALYGSVRNNLNQESAKISDILVSSVEHRAVLNSSAEIGKIFNLNLKKIPVDFNGRVQTDALEELLSQNNGSDDRKLVSVMASNNEIGTVQPFREIFDKVKSANENNIYHCDAVQGAGWLNLPEIVANSDLVSISSHKLGGPVGVGALIVNGGQKIMPQIIGGGQERQRRSGTNDVIGAAGLAMAVKLTLEKDHEYFKKLKQKFVSDLLSQVPDVFETVPSELSVDGMVHLTVKNVNSEELLFLLDESDLAASAGSACSSGSIAPSHVLQAIGVADSGSAFIRLSFGWSTTEVDLNGAVSIIKNCTEKLR